MGNREIQAASPTFHQPSLGLGEGEVAAIWLDSSPELVVAYLGAIKAGVVPNVVNGMLRQPLSDCPIRGTIGASQA
jgi:acyl-coenzyme A synthetase/AMP-(fatty) acid ligase